MNAEERKAIKAKILKDIESTTKKVGTLKELSQPIAPEDSIGRVSRMDAINNKSINEAALKLSQEKLIELEAILPVLDDPDFGKCQGCGTQISMGRVMVMPHRRLCMKCAR